MKKLLFLILFSLPLLLLAQSANEEMLAISKTLQSQIDAAATQKDKKSLGNIYGTIAANYLQMAKLSAKCIKPDTFTRDKKEYLNESIEYSNKSIEASTEAGDIEQLKASYKNLGNAQKMMGKVKDAMESYAKGSALKKNLFGTKKANEIEKKQIAYENAKRLDSIRRKQQQAEEHLRIQNQKLAQQQQELAATQQEKEEVNKVLQKTQTDLSKAKTVSEEKDRLLTIVATEKALLDANFQLEQSKQKLMQNKLQLELQLKDKAIRQQKLESYFYILACVAFFAIAILAYRSFVIQKRTNRALSREKKRSEELLLNILPAEVAEELMEKGFADAKHFSDVTVLFTDFVSFTSIAETMTAQQLVGELHICFKAFDGILDKYHIEKIKTVGDAYMAVSGLPIANPNHASDIAAAAIEIRDFMVKRKKELGKGTFNIRVGINSGEVVAGIVGVRKFSYDIWGDTVNIAARMEQNSEDGKINVSESTYQLIKDKYPCIYRGKIEAKNKGSIDMYYIVQA